MNEVIKNEENFKIEFSVLKELEKKELLELVDKYGITIIAKNKSKPSNAELIDSISAYKKEQDIINGTDKLSDADIEAELLREEKKKDSGTAIPNKKLPRQQRARLQRADLMRKELVMIHDNRTSQTKPNVEFVTWGNGLIGMTTDVIGFNLPKGQYVHRGALQNLRNAPAILHEQEDRNRNPEMIEVPAFTIIDLAGLTDEEIAAKARQQKMRDAGVAI